MRRSRVEVRVRYPEVDRMGFAHHSAYAVWLEIGRTELLREAGAPYGRMEDDGLLFPVVEIGLEFRAPARYDEVVTIDTRVTDLTGARVRFDYVVRRAADGALLAEGHTRHGAMSAEGRACRIPDGLRASLLSNDEDTVEIDS